MHHKLRDESAEEYGELNEWDAEMATERFCRFTGRLLGDIGAVETYREFNEPERLIDFDAVEAMDEDRFFGRGRMLLTSEIWDSELD